MDTDGENETMQNEDFKRYLSRMTKEEVTNVAFNSVHKLRLLINNVIHVGKFMEMPDDVLQEILMMGDDPLMFKAAMKDYYKSLEDDGDPFLIIDASTPGKVNGDKSRNTSENDPWR